jgi:hypothetical protein
VSIAGSLANYGSDRSTKQFVARQSLIVITRIFQPTELAPFRSESVSSFGRLSSSYPENETLAGAIRLKG